MRLLLHHVLVLFGFQPPETIVYRRYAVRFSFLTVGHSAHSSREPARRSLPCHEYECDAFRESCTDIRSLFELSSIHASYMTASLAPTKINGTVIVVKCELVTIRQNRAAMD